MQRPSLSARTTQGFSLPHHWLDIELTFVLPSAQGQPISRAAA